MLYRFFILHIFCILTHPHERVGWVMRAAWGWITRYLLTQESKNTAFPRDIHIIIWTFSVRSYLLHIRIWVGQLVFMDWWVPREGGVSSYYYQTISDIYHFLIIINGWYLLGVRWIFRYASALRWSWWIDIGFYSTLYRL